MFDCQTLFNMNLAVIQNPRGSLEAGMAALVADTMSTYQRLNSVVFVKDSPRLEITVKVGQQRQSSKYVRPGENIIRYDTWDYSAAVEIFTRPNNDPEQSGLHSDLVSLVAGLFSGLHKTSWTDTVNFPSHYIAEPMRETGRPSSLNPEKATEQTTLNFTGIVGVKQSAWR